MIYSTRRRPPKRGPAKRPVDGQRSKLYAAESEAFSGFSTPTIGPASRPDLRSHTACEIWVNRQLRRKRLRDALGKLNVVIPSRVTINPTGHSGGGGSSRINAGTYMRNEPMLLHELAHTLNDYGGGWRDTSGHGREYARVYLTLVRYVLGTFWERQLRKAFAKHGVKYKPKRSVSPERRTELVARLAKIRQAARGHEPAERSAEGHGADGGSTHRDVQRAGSPALQPSRSLSVALALANSESSYT